MTAGVNNQEGGQGGLAYIAAPLRALAVPISDLHHDPSNARKHDERNIEAIVASLSRFGQRLPIVVQKQGMIVRAGNGRLAAAKSMGWSHMACVVVDEQSVDATAYAIADNRTAELATWDDETLASLLQSLPDDARLAAGYDDGELKELLDNLTPPEVVEDEAPEPLPTPVSRTGDLWVMGGHRLLCGDSTKAEDVGVVMAGERAGLCFTSPPYAQQREYTAASKEHTSDWDGLMRGVFGNLPMADDGQVLVNLGLVHRDGEWLPYWDGWIAWMREQQWKRFGWYVWDKGQAGRAEGGRLPTEHEFVWHFNRQSIAPSKVEPCKTAGRTTSVPAKYSGPEGQHRIRNKESTTADFKVRGSVCHVFRNSGSDVGPHPAAFPVDFAAYWVESWPGTVYEPFSGSGTTIVAAEQLGRRCFAIEIETLYVDVAVRRWQKLTGKEATHEATGKTWRETAAERGVAVE